MANYVTGTSDKSKGKALKLCCMGFIPMPFFCGLHQFYVGKCGKGILYMFTLGFFWIGTILDAIKILKGEFRDNVGAPLRE